MDTTTMPAWRPSLKSAPAFRLPHVPLRYRLACGCTLLLWLGLLWVGPELTQPQFAALAVFGAALIAWTLLRWEETPVAIAAVLMLVLLGGVSPEQLYATLGHQIVWLLIGAFLLAAVLQSSGLVERLTLRAVRGARSNAALLHRVAWAVAATAFVLPSTSARAALLLPVFLALARSLDRPRMTLALALLFPSVILLSAAASLLGAGAHLVAVDFMARLGQPTLGFLQWALLAAPFAAVSTVLATALISRLFLDADERAASPTLPPPDAKPLSREQRRLLVLLACTCTGFVAGSWLALDAALVAMAAAVVATQKGFAGVDLKTALKKVEWNLVLFLAATLLLGQALLDSGAAALLTGTLVAALLPLSQGPGATAVVLVTVVLVSLLSHLVITSRTARALVLIPTLALPMAAGGLNPALLVMVVVLGSGFCQTLNISAKPVTLFARADLPTYREADLLRLALWLLPALAFALLAWALLWWPLMGLPLRA